MKGVTLVSNCSPSRNRLSSKASWQDEPWKTLCRKFAQSRPRVNCLAGGCQVPSNQHFATDPPSIHLIEKPSFKDDEHRVVGSGLLRPKFDALTLSFHMEILSPSTPNGGAASHPPFSADPILVLEHIAALIQTTLGAARRELEAVGSLLSKAKHSETLSRCARFASESQLALYAQKDQVGEAITNGHNGSSGNFLVQNRRCTTDVNCCRSGIRIHPLFCHLPFPHDGRICRIP